MKWEKVATAPLQKPVLVHAKVHGHWLVMMAYQYSPGVWLHYPGHWAGDHNATQMRVRMWAYPPRPPFIPKIDQKKMLIGRLEAEAQREHARRIAAGIED